MLMHEVPEGSVAEVGGFPVVHPTGCMPMRVPSYLTLMDEKDKTVTMSGPIVATRQDGSVCNCFLIHDVWYVIEIPRHRAA